CEGFSTQRLIVRGVAQSPQPRAMRRHALNRITHRPERPQRSRIDTERHRLAAAQPAADVCPVIDRARSQRLGTACGKGAPDCPLYRAAALGRRARPFAQIRVVCPFHWRDQGSKSPSFVACARLDAPKPPSAIPSRRCTRRVTLRANYICGWRMSFKACSHKNEGRRLTHVLEPVEARVMELYGYAPNAVRAYQPLVVSETRPTVQAFRAAHA